MVATPVFPPMLKGIHNQYTILWWMIMIKQPLQIQSTTPMNAKSMTHSLTSCKKEKSEFDVAGSATETASSNVATVFPLPVYKNVMTHDTPFLLTFSKACLFSKHKLCNDFYHTSQYIINTVLVCVY